KNEPNNFLFSSNGGNWLFDFRRVFMHGQYLEQLCCFFWDKYEDEFPFQVGGLETGAIPFVTGIILEGQRRGKQVHGFFIRKQRKLSGIGNRIEGKLTDEKIIIVDDLFHSGESINIVRQALEADKRDIYKIFVWLNFGSSRGKSFLEQYDLSLDFEFSLSDFGLNLGATHLNAPKHIFRYASVTPPCDTLFVGSHANRFLEVPKSNPLKYGKNIYIGGESGKFLSLCSDTGRVNWEFQVDQTRGHKNILSSPLRVDDTIVFGSYDGNLSALDINDGSLKWSFIESDWIGSSACFSSKDASIFIGLEHGGTQHKGSFACLDYQGGEKKWEIFFDDYVHCSPAYHRRFGLVFCGGNDGRLVCARSDNGNIVFELQLSAPIKGGFCFSEDETTLYFGCFDSYVYAIDVLSGKLCWKYKTNNAVYAQPFCLGNNIYIGGTDKYFYHISTDDGSLLHKIETHGKIFAPPVLIDETILAFASNDSHIYFYDFVQKKVLFRIRHPERISTQLIYDTATQKLYVYDFLNRLSVYPLFGYL
ncbi:PQQ-binding-like beta-propeller repeat protein, partial [Candidatus Gracilibacteria bacterium]|nr:PQQ-binding-like beta-propeller repeat protein [Candidatus Gracilibacteria bacterium]